MAAMVKPAKIMPHCEEYSPKNLVRPCMMVFFSGVWRNTRGRKKSFQIGIAE